MLQSIVGPVDAYSATVLVAIAACFCIVATTTIARFRRQSEISNEFELARAKQQDDRDLKAMALQTEREVKFKQLDQNLITSHARRED